MHLFEELHQLLLIAVNVVRDQRKGSGAQHEVDVERDEAEHGKLTKERRDHTEHVVREAGKEIDRLRHEVQLRDEELSKVRRDADGLQREVTASRRELQILKEIEMDCQSIQERGHKDGLLPPMKEAKSLLHVMYEASLRRAQIIQALPL